MSADSVGPSALACSTVTWSATRRSLASSAVRTPPTSLVPGAIHRPLCSRPKPAQMSWERRSCRVALSGSEKPTRVQVPSHARLTAPVSQTRLRPSSSTSSARSVSPKYVLRPRRWRASRPRLAMRASVDLTASSETPRRANTSMRLPE